MVATDLVVGRLRQDRVHLVFVDFVVGIQTQPLFDGTVVEVEAHLLGFPRQQVGSQSVIERQLVGDAHALDVPLLVDDKSWDLRAATLVHHLLGQIGEEAGGHLMVADIAIHLRHIDFFATNRRDSFALATGSTGRIQINLERRKDDKCNHGQTGQGRDHCLLITTKNRQWACHSGATFVTGAFKTNLSGGQPMPPIKAKRNLHHMSGRRMLPNRCAASKKCPICAPLPTFSRAVKVHRTESKGQGRSRLGKPWETPQKNSSKPLVDPLS